MFLCSHETLHYCDIIGHITMGIMNHELEIIIIVIGMGCVIVIHGRRMLNNDIKILT